MTLGVYHYLGTPIFRGSASGARAAASDRLAFLMPILRRYQQRPPPYEIIEKPPGYEDVSLSSEPLDDASAAAQMAQLEHQASSEQGLLFARVTDAVICIARQQSQQIQEDPASKEESLDIAVRPIKWWERRRNSFPWVAVIGTSRPELFRERLFDLRDWLGIGVNLTQATNFDIQRVHAQYPATKPLPDFIPCD